jgi:hypothetical protein
LAKDTQAATVITAAALDTQIQDAKAVAQRMLVAAAVEPAAEVLVDFQTGML